MKPKDYERIIAGLGLSQAAAGRFLGHNDRLSRYYISGESEIPLGYEMLLNIMAAKNISPQKARALYSSVPWNETARQMAALPKRKRK